MLERANASFPEIVQSSCFIVNRVYRIHYRYLR